MGAISAKTGWVGEIIRDRSIKSTDALHFFQELREKLEGPFAVILDNASIHKAKIVCDYCEANEIMRCFLPPYTPQLQPIEMIWNIMKQNAKKTILKQMLNSRTS